MGSLSPLLAAVASVLAATGPNSVAAAPELSTPDPADLRHSAALLAPGRTRMVSAQPRRTLATWGGRYTTAAGEILELRFSDDYPQDETVAQRWVDFLASLAHGPEISTVSVYLAPLAEVQGLCGFGALACYNPSSRSIVSPGEDPDPEISAEAALAHEYGHHVAASRRNSPWAAIDFGTKRWASLLHVCRDAEAGALFPGAEDRNRYRLNPGEGFAESYRLLNERRLARTETPWEVVSTVFYPTDAALAALEQDVLTPWTQNTTTTVTGTFTKRGVKTRTHTLTAELDGNIAATLRAPATARLRVDLLDATGRVATATVGGGARVARTTACGTRSFRVRVTKLTGFGTYRLVLSRP